MRMICLLLLSAISLMACDDAAPAAATDAGSICLSPQCMPECHEDRDCTGGRICVEDRCVSDTPLDPCTAVGACLDAAVLDASVDACTRNGDCAPGEACDRETRRCVPDTRACVDRSDCFADEICRDSLCQRGAPALDAGTPDAAPELDALPLDAHLLDAQPIDAQLLDAGPEPDAQPLDAQPLDAAEPDAQQPDTDAAAPDMFVPPATPPPGDYTYRAIPVGGLRDVARVAFHPDGSYALTLAVSGPVHVYDWATEAAVMLNPPGRSVYWADVAFAPGGHQALLVGYTIDDDGPTAVVYAFDDATWRAGALEAALSPLPEATRQGEIATAVKYDPDTQQPLVLLSRHNRPGYVATLRDLDLEAGAWGGFITATALGAGAADFDFVRDAFGGPAMLVVGGANGAASALYTTIGGVAEWQANPGRRNTGNLGSVARHPSRDYALIISWSGRRIHRFEGGVLQEQNLWYRLIGISRVAFQPNGRRALVVGRAGLQPVRGTVLEYRHDVFDGVTEVSIPDFDLAPYNATGNHALRDAAFHPGCDGGLLAGGHSDFNSSLGLLIRFDIAGGEACP